MADEATNPNVLPADDSQSPATSAAPTTPPGKSEEEWEGFQSEGVGPLPVKDTQLHPEEAGDDGDDD